MTPWIVLKYGGTSVSSAGCWDRIADRVGELRGDRRVWIVASAVSQVTNRLQRAVAEALAAETPASLAWIAERHRTLADELALDAPDRVPVEALLSELERLLEGGRLTREAPPRLRARILAFGALAATRLGVAALRRRGVAARWIDARDLLRSAPRRREAESDRYLEAEVPPRREPEPAETAAAGADVVLTQGFVARTPRGDTCLLGRGGSDTSGALFAALLGAAGLEIWTDVPGMFTADPREIPTARLIRRIGFREAQELAAMGAKVLHPRCLPPVAAFGIPLTIRDTHDPASEGTRIDAGNGDEPTVMAVVCRDGATLLTLSTLEMWGTPGFLARSFAPFEEHGMSVDLVATSQSAVSVTLDHVPGGIDGDPFAALLEGLRELGEVRVVHPCSVVSIVGRRIRTVLHELGPAMAVFREHRVHMVSQSSEDLNLSFVVGEPDARPLMRELHARLFPAHGVGGDDPRFGDTWEAIEARSRGAAPRADGAPGRSWWRVRRERLLEIAADGRARYVYDLATVRLRAHDLRRRVRSVAAWYYAVKANGHRAVLASLAEAGFGFECVSIDEVRRVREVAGGGAALLFTPNFCPVGEYAAALGLGAEITIDGPDVLRQAPETFRGVEVALRIDPGSGLGHHRAVRTAGARAKFGHPIAEVAEVAEVAGAVGAAIVGLHAHVGSGILDPAAWARVADDLAGVRERFPRLRWIDAGGGLGVPERPGQDPIDLEALDAALALVARTLDGVALRMEPGRYLVSEAGVLLAPVTQVRRKGALRFVGVATGMNSLIRPALYGAWHAIHNLTRIDDPASGAWQVVGPICESGDVLGRDRSLPETRPGDVLLIETCGAYGAVMASSYNLRAPAEEIAL